MGLSRLIPVILMLVVLSVFGCGNSGIAQQQATFNTVQKGQVSPYTTDLAPQISVLRNEVQWTTFWDLLHMGYTGKPPLPSVNFSESVVIAVVDTSRPSGGYSVAITKVEATKSGITVHASAVGPGQDCGVTLALTQPFHIVTVAPFTGEAILQLTESVANCGP